MHFYNLNMSFIKGFLLIYIFYNLEILEMCLFHMVLRYFHKTTTQKVFNVKNKTSCGATIEKFIFFVYFECM